MAERPPVSNWLDDWDHMDPAWTKNPYPIWDEVRASACPIATTPRYRGAYLPTSFADIDAIARDPEHFSSRQVVLREVQPDNLGGAPPITNDPPKHRLSRMVLMGPFSPYAVKQMAPDTADFCHSLIDKFIGNGAFDGAVDYAQHIPVHVIAKMLDVPSQDADQFRTWINQIVIEGVTDPDVNVRALHEVTKYFAGHLEARRKTPDFETRQDLVSHLARQTYEDGSPFKETHILGSLRLILVAGIDTTWSAIGAALWHLAQNPDDRQRLIAEPDLMRPAVEEFLRAYAPVTMARVVAKDKELSGCPMKAGHMLLLPFPSANRDPDKFDRPDEVILDRTPNEHVAFGIGIHRCIGMYLARMEIATAIETMLKRVPHFELAGETTWARGPIRGPRSLPLKFDMA